MSEVFIVSASVYCDTEQPRVHPQPSIDSLIENIDNECLENIIKMQFNEDVVFARATPSQKQVIMEIALRVGSVAALTGDGDVSYLPAFLEANPSECVFFIILLFLKYFISSLS